MAMQFLDRVKVYSPTVGTGALTIGAAYPASQGFANFTVGNTAYYVIEDGTSWECGIGTLTSSITWTRSAVIASSAGGTTPISCSGNQLLYLSVSAQTIIDTQSMAFYAPGRNRIRNPKFEINQRGTGPFTANGGYTSDGWVAAYVGTATGLSASVQAVAAAWQYGRALAVSATGLTAGSYANIVQRIESYECEDLVGQPVTVSFVGAAATTAGSFTCAVSLYYANKQDNSANYTQIGSLPVTLTGTAQRVAVTFPAMPAGVANGLSLNLVLTQVGATGSVTLEAGAVQLEPGTFATPLEHKPIHVEALNAYRYFSTGSFLAYGYITNGVGGGGLGYYATPMRAAPTVAISGTPTQTNCASGTINGISNAQYQYTCVGSGSGGYIFEGNYTASAEI